MRRNNAMACYRELGAELRKRREAAGLTVSDLAERSGWSRAKVSRFETGHSEIGVVDLIFYVGWCGLYRSQVRDLLAMCRDAERRLGYWLSPHDEWLEDSLGSLIYHEATARVATSYEPQLIPGLLQTADYARARIAGYRGLSTEEIDRGLRIRLERQEILHRPKLAWFTYLVHERALRLQVGSPAIMYEQLLKLVLTAALPHVTVRVVTSAAAEPWAFGGPFYLLEYAEHRPVVFLDNHPTGLFLDDPDYVEPYRTLLPAMSEVALDEGQSLQMIAALADEYDQGSERDAGHRLEEEHL